MNKRFQRVTSFFLLSLLLLLSVVPPTLAAEVTEASAVEESTVEESTFVEPSSAMSSVTGSATTGSSKTINTALQKEDGFDEDSWTGAFEYNYPIQIPKGRNGIQPDLALHYSNQDLDPSSVLGYGWSLEIPSIRRLNREGVDTLYDVSTFQSSLSGELVPLVLSDDVHGTYRSKIETGTYLLYEYKTDESWEVTDKSGLTFSFGTSTGTQDDSGTRIYRWFLERMEDPNGNFVSYSYVQSNGQMYPDVISYTGHGSEDGIFDVIFEYETRQDDLEQNFTGFVVQSLERVSRIEVQVENEWVRRYDLDYANGEGGKRSLLSSITESARTSDGVESSLPPTTFNYSQATAGWTQESSSIEEQFPVYIAGGSDRSLAQRFVDINGDGLVDIVYSYLNTVFSYNSATGSWEHYETEEEEVWINQGNGEWTLDTEYDFPVNILHYDSSNGHTYTYGRQLMDANGDGYVDVVASYNGTDTVYLNNKDKTWTEYTTWNIPIDFNIDTTTMRDDLVFTDVNADGFTDILQASMMSYLDWEQAVYLNNGDNTGWTQSSTYHLPHVFFDRSLSSDDAFTGYSVDDFNGDGLVDFLSSFYIQEGTASIPCPWDSSVYCDLRSNDNTIYLNQGDGTWAADSSFSLPTDGSGNPYYLYRGGDNDAHLGRRFLDINGDNLSDFLYSWQTSSINYVNEVWINKGDGTWQIDSSYSIPVWIKGSSDSQDQGVLFLDLDNNGLVDIVDAYLSGYVDKKDIYMNNTQTPPDLLTSISYRTGGSVGIEYKTTPNYFDGSGALVNPELPLVLQTVSELTVNDGLGGEKTVSYDYEGGLFYSDEASPLKRKFAGFESITKTESSRVTKTYYHQELELIGKSYKQDIYDSENNLYKRILNVWDTVDLGGDSTYVFQSDLITMDYDGGTSHRDSAVHYSYDSNGNIATQTSYGEVSANEDGSYSDVTTENEKSTTTFIYATDTAGLIRNKVSQESTQNYAGTYVKKTRYYYDGLALNSVSSGNLSTHSAWLNTTNTWNNSVFTYDAYGNVATFKNPRLYTTTYTYDSASLYPTVTSNPKSYTVSTSYDYATGQLTSQTDENGSTSESSYDGFGRLVSISVPDPVTGTLTELSTVTYDDVSLPSSTTTTTTVGGVSSVNVTYFDGLSRTVQTNTLAEDGNYSTVDTWYDEDGLVEVQSLPYFTSSSAYGRDANAYSVSTDYDVLGRPLSVATPTGTTSTDYSLWESTVTDPNGTQKVYSYDAVGHLLAIEEQNDGVTYTSSYDYDSLGRLVTLTDAQSNVRSFTYDSLDRKLSQTDLHDSSETSFGTWTYTYDKNNNLLTQTDPKGQIITWAYDQLDRVTYEDWDTSTPARNYTYTYDLSTRGRMRLYQLASGVNSDAIERYPEYDYLGNPSKETRLFLKPTGSTYYSYQFQTTNDLLSRPTKLIYPSSAITINYTYNATGSLEKVTRGATTLTNVISDIDYSPAGQVSSMAYGNGVLTTNTYDPAESYRLTHKVSTGKYVTSLTGGSTSNIQDLSYSYDNNGNITGIVDSSSTPSSKTLTYTYDDLSRLTNVSTSGFALGDYTQSYSYDEVGNLTSKSDVGTLTYSGTGAGGANPHAVTDVAGTAYTYDLNGNLTSDGTHTYTWDNRNRMSTGGTKSFSYDASGTRYKTTDSSSSTPYTYYMPYEELRNGTITSAGSPTYYIFAGGQRVASLDGTTYSYYLQDHLGGTSLTTNSGTYVTQLYDYYPYGSELQNTQLTSADAKHSFTDKELDDSLGVYYFEARWYDADIGRFISQDPAQMDERISTLIADSQSLNFYAYSRSNPINFVDPSGEFSFKTAFASVAQVTQVAYNVGSHISKTFLGGMATSSVYYIEAAPILIGGGLADLDDAYSGSVNAMGNMINAFQDEPAETFMEQGPIRDAFDNVDGLNELLDITQDTSNLVELIAGGSKNMNSLIELSQSTKSAGGVVQETGEIIFNSTFNAADYTLETATDKGLLQTVSDKVNEN